jgi:hypothetical protein
MHHEISAEQSAGIRQTVRMIAVAGIEQDA